MNVDEQVYVCDDHEQAIVRVVENRAVVNCPVCNTLMVSIGWIQHKQD